MVLLTPHTRPEAAVGELLPALVLLPHRLRIFPFDLGRLLAEPTPGLVLIDAVSDLIAARTLIRTLAATAPAYPIAALFADAGLAVLDESWALDDFLVVGSGPAEVAARVRRLLARESTAPADQSQELRGADVVLDEAGWSVRAGGVPLDLTYKEFELLRCLITHVGRVVTRDRLLQEVWGMGYYGGTRTVDVHIRRLRAKLGPERESLIETIRGVGYRFSGSRGN